MQISITRKISNKMRKGVNRHQHRVTLVSELSFQDFRAAIIKTPMSNYKKQKISVKRRYKEELKGILELKNNIITETNIQ